MTPEAAIDIVSALVKTILTVSMPLLLSSMAIGLAISLVQTVTSLHEQTLAFVPKVLGVLAILMAILPWLARTVLDYTAEVINQMPALAR
jgi:flagellar biosynthetic protein FliQ